jgi:lipopolysaccharide/colanic/teichoic acid biosynthesis glycosyltransferase
VVSKAELLGRLSFCGFKIISTKYIEDKLYFIAQKTKIPSVEQNPSYGPLIELKRIGYQGKPIYIKKLRTMHPYSEFIQDYIHDMYRMQENGKFKDDFRITEWGKFIRKIWLDELPQFANFFQGDVKFVGVRALSEHYFSLYPDDLRELRIQFKPGLVPPYYADMPKNFQEIVESERRYLKRKMEKPFTTDFAYFFKAMYNILFKHARSR